MDAKFYLKLALMLVRGNDDAEVMVARVIEWLQTLDKSFHFILILEQKIPLTIGGGFIYNLTNNTRHASDLSAPRRVFFIHILCMLFSKPPTSIEAQITLLRELGLIITDENRARHN